MRNRARFYKRSGYFDLSFKVCPNKLQDLNISHLILVENYKAAAILHISIG
uniref:Uncharacterized protein n=1 Tax=Arundo donax TaxID=35708 RepID=A0A0A9EA22_ARUDO